jgi:hypothetical protein
MLNVSQVIAERTDAIMQQWLVKVRQERQIESSVDMSDTALGDSLPILLKSLAQVLEHSQKDFFERIAK